MLTLSLIHLATIYSTAFWQPKLSDIEWRKTEIADHDPFQTTKVSLQSHMIQCWKSLELPNCSWRQFFRWSLSYIWRYTYWKEEALSGTILFYETRTSWEQEMLVCSYFMMLVFTWRLPPSNIAFIVPCGPEENAIGSMRSACSSSFKGFKWICCLYFPFQFITYSKARIRKLIGGECVVGRATGCFPFGMGFLWSIQV